MRADVVRTAFTLVELLVVIGIISVLISILMPALSAARQAGQAATCLSNVHQLSLALVAYINDNQGWLPYQTNSEVDNFASPAVYQTASGTNWLADLSVYYDSMTSADQSWICPTAALTTWNGANEPNPPSDTNYMANGAVLSRRLSRISDTANIVWVQEDRYCWGVDWVRPDDLSGTPPTYNQWCFYNGSLYGEEYGNIHNTQGLFSARKGGGNAGYVDGHADYRPDGSLHPSDFGLVGIPGTSSSNDPNTVNAYTTYYGAFDN